MGARSMTLPAALAAASLSFGATAAEQGAPTADAPAGEAPAAGVSQARLDYGAYLALAGNCVGCHTRPDGKPLEGGRALQTPYGTVYTPNITPAEGAGIGHFSDDDFLRAMHRGVAPDGQPYYPAFPYASYAAVRADDVLAIKDYLFSLEPSDYRPPRNELRWPVERRDVLFGWQEQYLERGRLQPDPDKSEAWNRGAYLVQGLGHCAACHLPSARGGDGGPEGTLDETAVRGWLADSVAPDLQAAVGDRTAEALADSLRNPLEAPAQPSEGDGTTAAEAHAALPGLALSDLRAIALYLSDMPAAADRAAAGIRPGVLAAEQLALGGELYADYCSSCHQHYGQGIAPYFPALRDNPAVTPARPDDVVKTILLGAPADPADAYSAHVVMPSFGTILNDEEIAAVASFIRASWGNGATLVAPERVRELRTAP